jgi:multiple sugar transport system ATP-binding protein
MDQRGSQGNCPGKPPLVFELVLTDLQKRFGPLLAVDGVTLRVAAGELAVLVGPSGCGKTTTLRLIAGLEQATGGSIRIGDRPVDCLAPRNRDVAMVFQSPALYPHLSVLGNMAFGLRMRRVQKHEIQRRVAETAELLGIKDLLERRPAELSGGQQQRVALGRALVRRPAVLLLDEPFSSLDVPLRDELRRELGLWQRKLRITTVHVTHDQQEAMQLGQRIVVLNEGRVQQIGTPMEIYNRPANRFVGHFMGSPRMNFFPARLVSRSGQLWLDAAELAMRWSETPPILPASENEDQVVLGIRPEHLEIDVPRVDVETASWRAEVLLVQTFGPETWLELQSASHRFTARIPPGQVFRPGDRVDVRTAPSSCHLFDPSDGRRLS